MDGKFTHYLITRFNVPVKNWDRDKMGRPTLSDSWMKERLVLFAKYCVPTIRQQTLTDFHWIVYCDRKTEDLFLKIIQNHISTIPGAEVRLADDYFDLISDLRKLMSLVSTPFVITSRVDNDDGLGKQYIEKVQTHFEETDKTIINLNGGVLYDLDQMILTHFKKVKLNHYGSLIEVANSAGDYITVLGYPHHDPPAVATVIEVPIRYGWLKIIHSRNLKSKTSGKPVGALSINKYYGVDKDDLRTSTINTLAYLINKSMAVFKRKLTGGRK